MRRHHFDPKRRFIHPHRTDAMNEPNRFNRPAFLDLIEQQVELVLRHAPKSLILKRGNALLAFASPHHSQKIDYRAHVRRNRALGPKRGFVDGVWGDEQVAAHFIQVFKLSGCPLAALHRGEQRNLVVLL